MFRKKKKVYKKVKFNRYFSPLLLFLFFLAIYVIVNFQSISYKMNKGYFKTITAEVIDETVDGLTNIIPINKVKYVFNNKEYVYDLYGIYNFKEGDKISIKVNKSAPDFIFVVAPNYISRYNDIFYLVFIICTLVHIRLVYFNFKYKRQRKELKKSKKK